MLTFESLESKGTIRLNDSNFTSMIVLFYELKKKNMQSLLNRLLTCVNNGEIEAWIIEVYYTNLAAT